MKRRLFLQVSGGALATAALPGCSAMVATPVTPANGEFRIAVRNFAQLEQAGGFLKVRPAGSNDTLYILALGGDRYSAVSPICTHLQCTVNIDGATLVCPCHGSTYDREGRVLRGPAERPLTRYRASLEPGGELVIRYPEASQ